MKWLERAPSQAFNVEARRFPRRLVIGRLTHGQRMAVNVHRYHRWKARGFVPGWWLR